MLLVRKPYILRGARMQSKRLAVVVRAVDAGVAYDYIDAYARYICKPELLTSCVENMILPPVDEQMSILRDLYNIGTLVDIEGLEGVFMKLLLAHDAEVINKLMGSLDTYNSAKEIINNIIRYSYEIPIEPMYVDL